MTWPNLGLSHRPVVMGTHGMVASANPLASLAGLRMLQAGGHAVDAAVAVAAALNVAEPYMSGIGGDGYMLVYSASERRLRALDYVGPAPRAATPGAFRDEEEKGHGPKSPLVPGNAAGWLTAHETYGRLDRAEVFAPAIAYAEEGVPISLVNAVFFQRAADAGHLNAAACATVLPGGAPPKPGTVLRQPLLAETFRRVVAGGMETSYRGELAERIVAAVRAEGGLLSLEDMASYQPVWREPIATTYRGYQVRTLPPPCSGVQYLQTLNILEGFDLAASGQNSGPTLHLTLEAMKLAVADRIAYTALPDPPTAGLLDKHYAAERRAQIDPERARPSEGERYGGPPGAEAVPAGRPPLAVPESTTHFDVVDRDGNAVAVTQSLGDGFGSGVMAGDTGLFLNNFAFWFDLDERSPNAIGPAKAIEMCMAPAAVFRDDRLFMVIGTPGSFGILQTTPQMISNVLDHGFSVQAAIEAPRVRPTDGLTVLAETRLPYATQIHLARRGHLLEPIGDWSFLVGGGQGIMIDQESGVLMGGADPRRDGYALGW
jgi:gamma-glutamyltranspeptidase/glutathione hydrolase